MSFRVAVVQFQISHLDRGRNLQRIEDFTQQAAKERAHVVIFPEDCMTGSIFGDLSRLDTTNATRMAFQDLAKKYQVDIVTGSCMEGTPEGNFNTSYYIAADGTMLGQYRKNHLYSSEYKFLQPGTEAPVFETAYGKAGIVICWDMLFPEIFQRMKDQGVQIIYCPSYWYKEIAETIADHNQNSEEQLLDALCLTRAVETNSALVYCNAADVMNNPNGSRDTLIGHSQVVLPGIGIMQRISTNEEKMLLADIDLDILVKTAKIYHS